MLTLDKSNLDHFLDSATYDRAVADMGKHAEVLQNGSGDGAEMRGWLTLPQSSRLYLDDIMALAEEIRAGNATLICIGIGGSYLGAQAVISALAPGAKTVFAGHHLEPGYLKRLMNALDSEEVYLNVISKSGTTTEPALVFRIIAAWLKQKYPTNWRKRVIVTTDPERGALHALAEMEKIRQLPIPADVGGRFSVLTSAGLLPMAAAGLDLSALLDGAGTMAEKLVQLPPKANPAHQLAALRTLLYNQGYKIEILASFHPRLAYLAEWWKQLAGESEGKDNRGIFPASCTYTTDLHALGQWIQEGERTIFETFLWIEESSTDLAIPDTGGVDDGLGYLAGRSLNDIQKQVLSAVVQAHTDGGVPCSIIRLPKLDEDNVGGLLYFFEYTVALTAYAQGINPFNQPGVEAYKQEMFRRLGKPGAE
jgi:glucose-6-phosphate isomerase